VISIGHLRDPVIILDKIANYCSVRFSMFHLFHFTQYYSSVLLRYHHANIIVNWFCLCWYVIMWSYSESMIFYFLLIFDSNSIQCKIYLEYSWWFIKFGNCVSIKELFSDGYFLEYFLMNKLDFCFFFTIKKSFQNIFFKDI